MGHVFLNKTRLQNTVDAAALAAAKVLDKTGNTALATAEAMQAFGRQCGGARAIGSSTTRMRPAAGDIQVTVEYSSTLPPFTPGSATGPYVRVRATGFVLPAWLVRVGGIMDKTVAATAVAGPRTLNIGSTVCNVAPMMVCGNSGAPGMWGYTLNAPAVLKKSTPGGQSQRRPRKFPADPARRLWRGRSCARTWRAATAPASPAAARSRRRPATRPVRSRKG